MKFFSVIAITVLCFLNSVDAQNTIQKNKIYRTWITLNSKPFKTTGVLYEIKDSSILVSNSLVIQDYSTDRFGTFKLHINDIETIKIRRKKRVGTGVLLGAITGFCVGGIIGLIDGDDPPCRSFCVLRFTAGQKALMAGIPLSIVGAVAGAIIGSVKIKIPINGSMDNYHKYKKRLKKYSFKK